jgi:hypothetical protein
MIERVREIARRLAHAAPRGRSQRARVAQSVVEAAATVGKTGLVEREAVP